MTQKVGKERRVLTGDHGVVSVWDIGDDKDRRTIFLEFAWEMVQVWSLNRDGICATL